MRIVYFIIGLSTVHMLECYLLLQVHKGDNLSDVDALVHKQLPPRKFDELARAARGRFRNYERYRIKGSPDDESVDSIVFAFKTDDEHLKKRSGRQENHVGDIFSYIKNIAGALIRPNVAQNRRSKLEITTKKQTHSSDGKPSLQYEMDTTSVLDTLSDALSSNQARRYSDGVAKAAAYIYNAIMEA